MRVTIIIDHFLHANAGTEHQLAMLLEHLASRLDVELITFRESPWVNDNAARLGIAAKLFRIDNFKRPRTYGNLLRLRRHLRRSNTKVVHTFFPVANIFGVFAARAAGVPIVLSSRRDFGEWMSTRYLRMTRAANRFVDGIVTNSARVLQRTCDKEGFPRDKIHVIANGIDVARFASLARSESLLMRLGIPRDAKVVGLVANYRPMKRHETLVRAAQVLHGSRPDIHFLLVGRNMTPIDIEGQLRRLANDLGVATHVHFANADGNVREYLGLLDVAANCSEGEGLSNAIMEYMAANLPCIVADSGGNPDLIKHEVNGLLFELDSHEELARAIVRVLDDASLAARLAANAHEWLVRTCDVEAMAQAFTDLYSGLAGVPHAVTAGAARHEEAA